MNAPANQRRRGRRIGEKPKDFKGTVRKLLLYCRQEVPVIITALVLAVIGTVMMIIGPDQISRITDYIYNGLTGGLVPEEAAADIQAQIQSGELSIFELMSWLPKGTDLSSLDLSNFDLMNSDDPAAAAILEHLKLSDAYITSHQGGGIDLDGIMHVSVLLLTIYMISGICTFLQHFIMATVTQKISRRMRGDLDHKINMLPLAYFTDNAYGDVLSRVTNDVDMIGQGLANSSAQVVTAFTQFVGCLIMMFITNAALAVTSILTSVFSIVFIAVIMKHSQKYFMARQQNLGALNGYIEEMYSGHDVIRISDAENQVKERFNELNGNVREANFKSQFLGGLMQPVMNFVGNLGYVAVCVMGAVLVINGKTTFGVITAFLIYVRMFEQPLRQFSQSMVNVQSAGAAAERVFEFLNEAELPDESGKLDTPAQVRGEVAFENVKFAYPSAPDREIIHGFNARILPGQKVAIVGPTGAGKTTIVNLLMRFFEPNEGDIRIDGVKTSDMKRSAVHELFGMVLQDTWLFEGTVRENLVYNCRNISDDLMITAAKACGIHRFIEALPQGYETVLDDNTAISAGQKQLFTIARAMIQNSPMLILDEATSSVDTRTELITQQAMDQLTAGRTSFVIAHRLSTVRNADVIFVVRDGDIVEQGNHEELMAQNGFYAELYQSQFEE